MPYKKGTPHKLKGSIKHKCTRCNSEYFRSKSASVNTKYCSLKCRVTGQNKKENHPRWKGGKTKLSCTICGSKFERAKCRSKEVKRFFCSCRCRMLFYRPNQKNKETDIERKTKIILDELNIEYISQVRLKGICIADFFIPKSNVAIFCDGDYWHNFPYGKPRDKKQIEELDKIGIKGIRFWGSEIKKHSFKNKIRALT